MHPAVIVIPAIALVFGPRLWVKQVLRRHNQEDMVRSNTAAEVARALLDGQNLRSVKVECTDLGDHYDPEARAVRLARDKFDRRSLTAITTAAHEVGHAVQHANDFTPFVWRIELMKIARVAGEMGTAILLSVPIAALVTRNTIPPAAIGVAILGIVGSGLAVQMTTLPTEIDASFNKALGMLADGYVEGEQLADAKKILMACSLTYVASSLISVLHVWPWLPRASMPVVGSPVFALTSEEYADVVDGPQQLKTTLVRSRLPRLGSRNVDGSNVMKQVGKPLIRAWLKWSNPRLRNINS